MMTSQGLNREQITIVEKMTKARSVAYIRFYGVHEVGKRIWMVRDWILGNNIGITGFPSCIFYPANNSTGAAPESSLCEVQWDLPALFEQSIGSAPGGENSRGRETRDNAQKTGIEAKGSVKIKRVRPERVLSAIHRGDTDTIDKTICFLEEALQEAGYGKAGLHREIYLFDVHFPKSMWMTEIQVPVMKRGQAPGCEMSMHSGA